VVISREEVQMKKLLAVFAIAALAACGDDVPPPKPAAQEPAPQAAAPAPAATPAPEAKAPETPKPDPNKELAQRVKQALEGDAKVQAGAIDVTAKDGRVSLWGTAATAGERSRAADIASKVQGVASVDNQIKIVKGS
jgi:hyperosmotically inducible periplasmic protein